MRRGFGAHLLGVYRFPGAVHDVIVNAVFDTGRAVLDAVEPLPVGFILREQQLGLSLAIEHPLAIVMLSPTYIWGRGVSSPQDQVLRNQIGGKRWISAASGPRLMTWMRTSTSSGEPLAYSTKTSK